HDRDALAGGMMAIGSRLARAVNRVGRRSGPVLADRYHVRLLKTPREGHRALRYVLLNAPPHAAAAPGKLAGNIRKTPTAVACLDRASSARWFDGWKRPGLGAAMRPALGRPSAARAASVPPERPAVARARTWLLTVGWRRHGLLDPADIP